MSVLRFDGNNWVDSTSTKALRFTGSGYADIEDINRRSSGNWINAYSLPGRFRFYMLGVSSYSITKIANNKVIVNLIPNSDNSTFDLIFMTPIIANKTVAVQFSNTCNYSTMVVCQLLGDGTGNTVKNYSIGTTGNSFTYANSSTNGTTLKLSYSISNYIGKSISFTIENHYTFANDTTYLSSGNTNRAAFDWDNVTVAY